MNVSTTYCRLLPPCLNANHLANHAKATWWKTSSLQYTCTITKPHAPCSSPSIHQALASYSGFLTPVFVTCITNMGCKQ